MKKKKQRQKGLVICFTGKGKGKTTAALGMVMRAIAHRKKVLLVQFLKNTPSGEIDFLRHHKQYVTVCQYGSGFCKIAGDMFPLSHHKKCVAKGIAFVRNVISRRTRSYDLIILDEINLTFKLRLLNVNDLVDILKRRNKSTHIVLTGRSAPKKIKDMSDLVSEIREVKHPYAAGIPAQPIIEY
ncbi:MAG: cob(I)yrinic acid a,c-diamide adenosyltransferase [Candidatus Omnitrophica bacterium]|nr:cob(I)yrinic acid a,c-diamide adenosyltransferase [Candidatus Omnitrophota bacterium]